MPKIKQQLDTLLTKEMDRKHFLQYSGSIILAVLGISGLLKVILSSTMPQDTPADSTKPKSFGYGSSRFGN